MQNKNIYCKHCGLCLTDWTFKCSKYNKQCDYLSDCPDFEYSMNDSNFTGERIDLSETISNLNFVLENLQQKEATKLKTGCDLSSAKDVTVETRYQNGKIVSQEVIENDK